MSKAHELITNYFDCLKTFDASVDRCADLFADDGIFDFPYLSSLGMPNRFEGKAAVREVLNLIKSYLEEDIPGETRKAECGVVIPKPKMTISETIGPEVLFSRMRSKKSAGRKYEFEPRTSFNRTVST
jgi:hypothetical protein